MALVHAALGSLASAPEASVGASRCGCAWTTRARCLPKRNDGSRCWVACCNDWHAAPRDNQTHWTQQHPGAAGADDGKLDGAEGPASAISGRVGSWLGTPSALETTFRNLDRDGPRTRKWAHGFAVVDRHLSRFRGTDVVLLEIGINMGGSLRLWREYLGKRATIIGVDVFDASFMQGNPLYGSPNLTIDADYHKGFHPVRSEAFWTNLSRAVPRLDVIVDDGGHTAVLQRASLDYGVPRLAPGGVYIC